MRTHTKPTCETGETGETGETPQSTLTETEVNILDLFKENEQPATSDNELEDMLHMLHNINELNAIEMSIVQDEEELLQSQWIDVSALATEGQQSEQISVVPTAIPTTIQSYINLQPQITPLVEYQQQEQPVVDDKLKSLTEDIGICKCEKCNCSQTENCHGTQVDVEEKVVEGAGNGVKLCNGGCLNNNCKCNDQLESYFSNGNCCIMVCLKTIEQLRQMLNLANKCVSTPFTPFTPMPLNMTSLSSSCCQQLIQTIPLTPSQFHA